MAENSKAASIDLYELKPFNGSPYIGVYIRPAAEKISGLEISVSLLNTKDFPEESVESIRADVLEVLGKIEQVPYDPFGKRQSMRSSGIYSYYFSAKHKDDVYNALHSAGLI